MNIEELKLAIKYLELLKDLPGKHYREIDNCVAFIERQFGLDIDAVDKDKLNILVEAKLKEKDDKSVEEFMKTVANNLKDKGVRLD